MRTAQLFNPVIDLPKSQYFFTRRCTLWQAIISILAIIFVSIDTAINDIIDQIICVLKEKIELMGVNVITLFYPKYGYA